LVSQQEKKRQTERIGKWLQKMMRKKEEDEKLRAALEWII